MAKKTQKPIKRTGLLEESSSTFDNLGSYKKRQDEVEQRLDGLFQEVENQKNYVRNSFEAAIRQIRRMESLVWLGFVIVIIMVAGMLSDIWRSRETTYESLKDEVNIQNAKLDIMFYMLQSNFEKGPIPDSFTPFATSTLEN